MKPRIAQLQFKRFAWRLRRLMVSHNNEYKEPESGHSVDKKQLEKMMRSTEGL